MKKLIIPIIIIAALMAAPWVVGNKSHQQLEATLNSLTENNPGVSYEIKDYKQSIFTSTGKIHFKYDEAMLGEPSEDVPEELINFFKNGLVFNVDITHGPVLTKPSVGLGLSHTKFSLDTSEEPLKSFAEKTGVTDLLYGDVYVDLAGNGTTTSYISKFALTEDEANIDFGGAEINQSFDKNLNYDGNAFISALALKADALSVNTSPITMEFKGKLEPEFNWGVGKFTSKMSSIKFDESGEGSNGEVSDVSLVMDITEPSEGLYDIQYVFSVSEVNGSALENPLSNINYDMTFKSVSKAAVLSLNQLGQAQDPNLSPEEQAQKMEAIAKTAGEELLKTSPSVALNALSFNYGDSTFIDMKGNFGINSDMIPDASMLQANPMMAIPALKADLDANFSENVISEVMQIFAAQQMEGIELSDEDKAAMKSQQEAQAQMMIAQFVEMGYITKNDKGLATKATFENGQLLVNGNPMPFGF